MRIRLPTLWLILLIGLSTKALAKEITVNGKISGAGCAVEGMLCPSTPEHMQNYELMGIYTDEGKFFIPINVPQNLLHANFLKNAELKGVDLGNGMVKVKRLTIEGRNVFDNGYLVDPLGHKVKYSEAIWKDGEYLCPQCAKME